MLLTRKKIAIQHFNFAFSVQSSVSPKNTYNENTDWLNNDTQDRENMDLPERSTSTNMSSFNSTATDAKMGVPFYTSLYIFTYIKIHSRREKYALNKRNASHVKISCFG